MSEQNMILMKAEIYDLSKKVQELSQILNEREKQLSHIAKLCGMEGENIKIQDLMDKIENLVSTKVEEVVGESPPILKPKKKK